MPSISTDAFYTTYSSTETDDLSPYTSVESATTDIASPTVMVETDTATQTITSQLATLNDSETCTLHSCLPNGCNCIPVNLSDPEVISLLKAKLTALRESLLLDKKNLTMFRITKESVGDDRVSSKFTGAAGAFMILVAASLIVVPDVVTLVRCLNRKYISLHKVESW